MLLYQQVLGKTLPLPQRNLTWMNLPSPFPGDSSDEAEMAVCDVPTPNQLLHSHHRLGTSDKTG